jgi:hypothetical protein
MPPTDATLVTLDPTFEAITRADSSARRHAAPAPRSLAGLRLGLLANGKINSEELLDALQDELQKQAGASIAQVVRVCKTSVSIPPRPEDMRRLVEETDAVLVAVGD